MNFPKHVQSKTIPECDVCQHVVGCDEGVCCFPVFEEPPKPLKKTEKEGLSKQQCLHNNETMRHVDHVTGHQYDLIEVCAPWDSPLTTEVEKKGGKAMRLGLHNGYDLSTRQGLLKAAKVVREKKPRNLHFAPPCFPWSQMQNINQRNPEQCANLEEKREHSRKLLKNLDKLAEIQHCELGGDTSGEQPWTATTWKEKSWDKMTRRAGGRFRVDGCRYGMKHPKSGLLLQKGWGFFASMAGIRLKIARTCNHPAAMHDKIEGNITAQTAVYPTALCRCFADGLLDRNRDFNALCKLVWTKPQLQSNGKSSPKDCETVFANLDNPGEEPGQPGEGRGQEQGEGDMVNVEDDDEQATAEERAKLRLIHRNLGHPSVSVMQRMLKQAQASPRIIKAAGEMTCEICQKQKQRKPVLPATPHVPREKWEVVSVDTFWWKHPLKMEDGSDKFVIGISFMDEASDLHVASVVRETTTVPTNVSGEEFKKKFLKDWIKCLPKPKIMRVDVEGCLTGGNVVEWLEGMMIQHAPIAAEAYWQVGKHSRHLHTLKLQMTKLAEELGNEVSCKEIVSLCVSAKNEMHAVRGYSPNQWAFGQNSDRIFSTLNCYEHLPNMSQENPSFHENIKKMSRAREVFIRCDSERKLARAATLKSRRQQEFETGMLVYYYRKGRGSRAKIRGQWHGPARVLFQEKTSQGERSNQGSIVWISHGTVLLRCAPEQLQPVGRDVLDIDKEINGPFSPDEFLKGSFVYQDLFGEKHVLEEQATGDEDLAWHHNPDDMKLMDDVEENIPESPEKRVRFETKRKYQSSELDRVAGRPTSHAELERSRQDGEQDEGGREDTENQLPRDVDGGAGGSAAHERQAHGEDLHRSVGTGSRLLRMVRRSSRRTDSLEAIPALPEGEDRAPGEDHGERQEEGIPQEENFGPIRRRSVRPGGVGRSDPYQNHPVGGDSASDGEEGRESRHDDEPDDAEHAGDHGASSGSRAGHSPAHGSHGPRTLEPSRSKRQSTSPEPGQGSTDKRLKTGFNQQLKVCEIVMYVGPRDVHYQKHEKNSGSWMVNSKTKRSAEVDIRNMTEEEHELMKKAKGKEIESYIDHAAVEIAGKCGVDPKRIMGMRWILTWKNETNEDGKVTGKKAKARLIIKGFQDPDLLRIQRDSPTLSTLGRNLLFSITSKKGWEMWLGDIKTAFLNGDDTEYERKIYGEPPEDVKEYLGMSPQQLFRVKKAVYGLLNAPRRWMDKLAKELENTGWIRSKLEPCVWRLYQHNILCGIVGVHVDDIVCSGHGDFYDEKVQALRQIFPFGSWKSAQREKVIFCGAELNQNPRGEITMNQERFALGLNEIPLSRERKQETENEATEEEKKLMKGLLGGVAWRANQTAPWLSASTSILQGCNHQAKVKDLLDANKLCRMQRAQAEVGLHFTSEIQEPMVVTFTDASHANRADGSSQGGSLTIFTDSRILKGEQTPFSILSWHSRKLKRISRSSTCAEVQACANAHDDAEFARQLLFEFENPQGINHHNSDSCVSTIPAAVICDAKNMYDAVTRIVSSGLQLEEKRLSLEVLSIKERCENTNSVLRWVDSDQQMADDLTKMFSVDRILLMLKHRVCSIVFDSTFTSAKKKRQERRDQMKTITPWDGDAKSPDGS